MIFALLLGGTLVGTALLWFACSRLEESTHRLAEHYGIPDAVKGSILLAVASSMPELVTALLAFPVHGDFELGLSAIIGSAIFNILVIPAFGSEALGLRRPCCRLPILPCDPALENNRLPHLLLWHRLNPVL